MLASAAWAFTVAGLMALQKPIYERVRLLLWMLFVYLVPLAAVIFLFHLDYFDFQAPIVYTFFIIVITMITASSWYLYRQPEIVAKAEEMPSSVIVKSWLSLIILVIGAWGVALFITDSGPTKLIWVWAGDLLSSRLIGAMLLTIATGAWYSRNNADKARVMLATLFTYAVGIALASAWFVFFGKPVVTSYLIVFGIMGIVTGLLLVGDKAHLITE
ncbi:MAG: hypothetical protein HN560_07665 [Anaerolineae bacterium]|nr:hypothetical protein [Anaerolineae bacterium]